AQELARRSAFAIDNARLYRKAREAIQEREDLMAIISHDLRNPLNTAFLAARQLEAEVPPAASKHTEMILRAATRMQHLLRDLIDFAAIGAGQLSIERKVVDVDPVITEVLASFEKKFLNAGIALAWEVEPNLPHVSCDRDRFIQILEN